MDILKIRATRGPNYYSVTRPKLIIMRLDLAEYSDKRTDEIPGFADRLREILPTGRPEDSFLADVEHGITAEKAIEFLALELQCMASMEVSFSRSEATSESGVYNVIFSYFEEEAGMYAGKKAVTLFEDLADDRVSLAEIEDCIKDWVQTLREIREDARFGPSTEALIAEAARRGIPHMRLNSASLVQLGYGRNQQRIQASITENTRIIAVDLAADKYATKELLADMSMPVPKGVTVTSEEALEDGLADIGFPVAIKPLDANQGKGITVNVLSLEDAKVAFARAQQFSHKVIVEQSLTGFDFRILVVNNKMVAAAKREPAHVVGDGKSTIAELIATVNEDPRRGYGHEKELTQIKIDAATLKLIEGRGQTPDTVLGDGEYCTLKTTANLSTGGTATDVTDEVHPFNVFLFERIAHFIGLDVCGVDIVAPDLSTPLSENGGGVVEVNAAPGLRMHIAPSYGTPRNIAEPIIDMLFPPGTSARIPILAITGTNGKTTTSRLIAHIIKNTGKTVGFTTSDGVYIGNFLASSGDNTGPFSTQMVLKDPEVDVAVLEAARGGIVRAGLGFDQCDVGVVTNITEDHLGLGDIDTIDQMAKVKSVVVEAVHPGGYAVLNADDDRVYAMRRNVSCHVALFSLQPDNPHVLEHIEKEGLACVLKDGWIVIQKGRWGLPVEKVIDIPLTYSGRATFNIQNVLAATLAAYCYGLKVDEIRVGLTTFTPSVAQTPGRLNIIELSGFTVLIDYAHNPAGMDALEKFTSKYPCSRKTAVLGGTGDRRNEDIVELGAITARMFDSAVVREDGDTRGRPEGETADLFIQGLLSVNPAYPYQRILNSEAAVRHALDNAQKDELVALLGGDIQEAIRLVGEYRDKSLPMNVTTQDIPNLGH